MAINGYNLSTKPYLRISGSNIETVVEIQLSEGNRYSTNSRSFPGDRTNESEDVLIQTNQIFTYKGESIKQLEGGPSQNGLLAVWKWDGTKNDKQTQTSNELETKPVQ